MKNTFEKEIKKRIKGKIEWWKQVDSPKSYPMAQELWWVLSEMDDIHETEKTGLTKEQRNILKRKKELEEELERLNKKLPIPNEGEKGGAK